MVAEGGRRGARESRGRRQVPRGTRIGLRLAALVTGGLTLAGCPAEHEAMLTPLWGCGLEGDVLRTVRVRARGDLPAADADSVLLDGGRAELADLPAGVDAVTVEGLFGETDVLAVGRTPRLPRNGTQPVYFSPPDQLCPVESTLDPRDRASLAVGASGDVIAVGGEGPGSSLFDEIVLLRDDDDAVVVAEATLPEASVGHTLSPIGDASFLLIGGATEAQHALGQVVRIDVKNGDARVRSPIPIEIDGASITGRAFHGAAALPDGRVLVQGGCSEIERARCVVGENTVLRSGFYARPHADGVSFEPAPVMLHPRYDHRLLAARDGVVFAVGGRDEEDQGVRDIEMLLPNEPGWSPYGPALFQALGEREIVGSTLLEGGLVILVLEDGTLWRVDQNHFEQLPGWCDDAEAPCFLGILPDSADIPVDFRLQRSLIGLWGERVLVDRFVVPVGILGATGADAVDLSATLPGGSFSPPGPRVGPTAVPLADGTVLGVGGRVPASGLLATPVVTRFRPVLDGPDEGTPDVSDPEGGGLVLHDRTGVGGRISAAEAQTLVLEPDPDRPTEFASTWVHFRGFRSRRFVFEGGFLALNGAPELHVVFSRGAIARTELALGTDGVRLLVRNADGSAVEVECTDEVLNFGGVGHTVGVVVSPSAIDVDIDGIPMTRCPWSGNEAVAVGLGAVGGGTIRANNLRLSRN